MAFMHGSHSSHGNCSVGFFHTRDGVRRCIAANKFFLDYKRAAIVV